jgi:hypothetical protein
MAKQNDWLNKQLDQAHSVVQSWSPWKRETIQSQIADVSGQTSSRPTQQASSGTSETGESTSSEDQR